MNKLTDLIKLKFQIAELLKAVIELSYKGFAQGELADNLDEIRKSLISDLRGIERIIATMDDEGTLLNE